ncbi:MAG: hypothetical protein IJE84_06345, partial [Clostridia bacterium]|nr:hypothetical protein [Clostridia bacterium]
MTRTKKSLLMSIVSMLLCLSMLMGTTYAWFTDSVATTGNRIVSGSLKIDLLHYSDSHWVSLKDHPDHKILNYDLWEPGHTRYERLQIKNLGNLALKYVLSATVEGGATNGANGERLSDVIDVYISRGDRTPASFAELKSDPNWTRTGTLTSLLYGAGFASGSLIPGTNDSEYVSIAFHMQESAGNEYQNLSVGDIHITLVATQYTYESDSFGNQYDKDSIFPDNKMSYTYTAPVTLTADNKAAADVALGESDKVQAIVPAGTKLKAGISELVFTVTDMTTPSNILVDADEDSRAVDVHVEGLASDNDVPVIVYLKEYMPTGLNMGNYILYHVENGTNVPMTYVADEAELDAHNEFTYDPATGDVKTALKSFSLVISVAETDFSWHGGVDHTWYMSHKKDTVLYISNADQLWSFSQIVGCMADWYGTIITSESSFKGKTIKLTSDINLGGAENDRNVDEHGNPHLFYPIGYYNSDLTYEKNPNATEYISSYFKPFEGTFDGQGHTISNIYMNTWEFKGDNEYYSAQDQCYRDGMGLFGKVWGGTVKYLTVANFTSDGEFTTTGVIAAYADSADGRSAVFENIAIKNCNPRVYNIGNGGIVGCVG